MYFIFLFFFLYFVLLCSLFFFNFRVLLPLKQTRKVLFSFKTTKHLTTVWMHMLFFEFFFFTVIPDFYSLFPAHFKSRSQMIFGIRHLFGQENHVFFELLRNFNFVDCVVDLCLVRLNGHLSSFSPLPHPRGFF